MGLVLFICVSVSSAAFLNGLQNNNNIGGLTSITKQSLSAALANHLASNGNSKAITYGAATPVVAENFQGITNGLATLIGTGNTYGNIQGITNGVAGNTQGITYGAATPVVDG